MKLTYFNIEEFDSPDKPGSGKEMDEGFLKQLDKAREIADVSFIVNSGFRTVEHNTEIGGINGSSHTLGFAVDLSCKDSRKRLIIIKALLEVGFTRIGISSKFIHVDNDPSKVENVVWVY